MVVGETRLDVDLIVIGGGPGGYTAALCARELGINTLLVDERPALGGVCLHCGCIPSKCLLHATTQIIHARQAASFGVRYGKPEIDIRQLCSWKNGIINKLSSGINLACKSSGIETIHGRAHFEDGRNIRVQDSTTNETFHITFKHAILATGSRPMKPRGLNLASPRILDSTSALNLDDIPQTLLVVGGGYIGLELGGVYSTLGSKVTVVEMTDGLLPGVDRDLVRPLHQRLQEVSADIYLNARVTGLSETTDGITVSFAGDDTPVSQAFERVLVVVGRQPNSDDLGLENTDVEIDKQGFVVIDDQCRTRDKNIFSVGDVSGQPMLAHRAMRQGHVVAEVLAGKSSAFDNRAIPSVVFTEPEIAWCGLTEIKAKEQSINVAVARFPWSASGRALTLSEPIGHTKIIYNSKTSLVLGVGMVGAHASELIAEAVLAIEMGACLEDLLVAIHPHPTLSETINEAAYQAIKRQNRQSKQ